MSKKETMKMFNDCDSLINIVLQTKEVNQTTLSVFDKAVANIDSSFIKSRHATEELKNMIKRFKDGSLIKACNHAKRFKNKTRAYANDVPFNVGDDVAIIRTERGWFNGRMTAKIIERFYSESGVWSYNAVVCPEGDYERLGGRIITINHTRDACLL